MCFQSQENFFHTAEEKLSYLLSSDGPHSTSSPALQTGTSASSIERRQSMRTSVSSHLSGIFSFFKLEDLKLKVCLSLHLISQHQVRSLGSFTPVTKNPSSTNGSTEKDPSSLKRKRAMDYLSRIPSPPPLTPLVSMNSPCVKKTFNPPRRSGTPSTLKTIQTPAPAQKPVKPPVEEEWVNDEELAMIDTQALL